MNTRKIEYSAGTHRKDVSWTAKKETWEKFCLRCKTPHVGKETHRDYMHATKSRQDELKDVGGFVGAILAGGNRLKKSVLYRTLLTLDVDHMTEQQGKNFWRRFRMLYDCAAVIYSTRKHTTEQPRYRLVIPFDRNVSAEEYPAIARKVAGSLGIDQFDITTYQAERLMYWPSTCSDGQFYYKAQEGPFLNPGDILAEYIGDPDNGSGWQDITQWPAGTRESKEIHKSVGLAGNPLTKPGIIGAFCNAYNIHGAIERFLSQSYTPAGEDRYTYLKGSTSGGLVLYDCDEAGAAFAYSHHGTDPVSGKLVNAFDLVRIHKFGLMDLDIENRNGGMDFGWDVTKLPSYKEMITYASMDAEVRKHVAAANLERAGALFADMPDTIEKDDYNTPADDVMPVGEMEDNEADALADDQEWLKKLDIEKKTGVIRSTIGNVVLILENDINLKDHFQLDDFKQQEIVKGKLPWRRVRKHDKWMTDKDEAALRYYLEKLYGISSVQKIRDAVDTVMIRHTIHPVREYLKALQWDGKPRIDTLFVDYLGAEDTEYVRAVTHKALLACAYRIMKPGVKFDNALVLVGEEGKKKSMLLAKLGGEWFSDSFYTVQGKESYEQIQGWWIIEMAELSALKKSEVEQVKHFLSKTEDSYRPAFGRKTAIRPRQCVFFGTTNDMSFLKRANGNRRFWPVRIWVNTPAMDPAAILQAEVDQIWAEAMEGFREGQRLWLDDDMYLIAKGVQEQHTEVDERLPDLIAYLEKELPENWYDLGIYERRAYLQHPETSALGSPITRKKVCTREIWMELFQGQLKDLDKRQSNTIIEMMAAVPGWMKTDSIRIPGMGTQRGYVRKNVLDR